MEVEALSSMCPFHEAGSPSSSASQLSATCSSSVAAGDVRQSIAFDVQGRDEELGQDARLGARDPEVREEARVVPVRDAGQQDRVEVLEHRGERLALLRRRRGEPCADLARLDLCEHGEIAAVLEVPGDPVDRRISILAKAHSRSLSLEAEGPHATLAGHRDLAMSR